MIYVGVPEEIQVRNILCSCGVEQVADSARTFLSLFFFFIRDNKTPTLCAHIENVLDARASL